MISILKNLAPEEVEYVIQRSAFNVDSPGYDILTGWGRLNAGGALEIVDTAKRKLHHFDSDSLTHTSILSLAASNTNLRLREKARNNTGLLFDHKYYKADVYKVTCTIPLPLSANDSIVAYWARNSSSDLYNYDATDSLLPHERITFEAIDTNTVVLSGYLVHLYDSATHTSLGWLPRDTSNYSDINFAISALTGDTIPNWNNIEEVKTRHSR